MKSLRERQSEFARKVPLLILYAYELGYEITIGDTWAPNLWLYINWLPERLEKKLRKRMHSRNSFHYKKLAIDINLFKDGKYLRRTVDHKPLGLFWESLGGTWGGRFRDGNHYSWGE